MTALTRTLSGEVQPVHADHTDHMVNHLADAEGRAVALASAQHAVMGAQSAQHMAALPDHQNKRHLETHPVIQLGNAVSMLAHPAHAEHAARADSAALHGDAACAEAGQTAKPEAGAEIVHAHHARAESNLAGDQELSADTKQDAVLRALQIVAAHTRSEPDLAYAGHTVEEHAVGKHTEALADYPYHQRAHAHSEAAAGDAVKVRSHAAHAKAVTADTVVNYAHAEYSMALNTRTVDG